MTGMRTRHLWLAVAVIVGLVAIAYWPIHHNGFVNIDDNLYVIDNPHVSTGLSWANVRWAFTSFYESNWHPLTWLSLMCDVQIWGVNPRAIHWVNVGIHALTSVLLFFLMQVTTRRWGSSLAVA